MSAWAFSGRKQPAGAQATLGINTDTAQRKSSSKVLRWAVAGGLTGGFMALIAFAPASWLARSLAKASGQHLLITDSRGSIWHGSGVLVLSGGEGSHDASQLPGRLSWSMGLQGAGLRLDARQDCCINGTVQLLLRPGWNRFDLSVVQPAEWLARWPAGWLAGLGAPWNTLQLGGSMRLAAKDFRLSWAQGRMQQFGQLDIDLLNVSSRVSTLAPLGSYRLSVIAQTAQASHVDTSLLQLSTLDGALILNGQGSVTQGKPRFTLEATAAPGREDALNNLLNIIGRRQGDRSVFSIG
ncbi:type II secretion system protein N [Roseateles koreensis]|uniref:Type II secretion system protein N n=1 Tax=Roseateles koreensis TaxID=2987526 RepID=A0ABT5KRC0_9BURK|nr:type II secretion system protein N [Roseateles koreensis]MDC8785456.1 type II secretion system protein N [Roseateles koreensis]